MARKMFNDQDRMQLIQHGLTEEEATRQIDLLTRPPRYLSLLLPCTAGDGIRVFSQEEARSLLETYALESPKRRCLKFIPASGAATRMFRTLLKYLNQGKRISRERILAEARDGEKDAQDLMTFMDGTRKFAFFNELKDFISHKDNDIDKLLHRGEFTDIIRFLVTGDGLNYAGLPKGLLKFHEYPEGSRTAFEEHLVEAAGYVVDQDREGHLHFTVSREHLEKFQGLSRELCPMYQKERGISFHVSFTIQEDSTDTLAVNLDNSPFRDRNGHLLFRPGGHGALLKNLNDLKTDIIFIKNIDNVVPDRLKSWTIDWKKILGGYLIVMQRRIFKYLKELSSGPPKENVLNKVMRFMRDELCMPLIRLPAEANPDEKRAVLMMGLNRPIRVCGMVKNVGEPGGGPFWVQDATGEISCQIAETAQVDPDSEEQQSILASSTHFNPVDLVCGVHNWEGKPFDLNEYVDPEAVFISQKSSGGKDLKALEHPGLWNGSMARWISLFVEVPTIIFNPVKTVNDLLRKEHQPFDSAGT
jgi:hypothetical protein